MMKRRDFLRNGLLLGSVGLFPGLGFAASQFLDCSKPDIKLLFQAIIDGKIETVEALIRSGVNVNAKGDNGYTALHVVTGLGSTDPVVDITIMKLLVENGANVNIKTDDGDTPLHNAAAWRSIEFFEFLVSNGADVRAQDMYAPLHLILQR